LTARKTAKIGIKHLKSWLIIGVEPWKRSSLSPHHVEFFPLHTWFLKDEATGFYSFALVE